MIDDIVFIIQNLTATRAASAARMQLLSGRPTVGLSSGAKQLQSPKLLRNGLLLAGQHQEGSTSSSALLCAIREGAGDGVQQVEGSSSIQTIKKTRTAAVHY